MEQKKIFVHDKKSYVVFHNPLLSEHMLEMSRMEAIVKRHDIATKRAEDAESPEDMDKWLNIVEITARDQLEIPINIANKLIRKICNKEGNQIENPELPLTIAAVNEIFGVTPEDIEQAKASIGLKDDEAKKSEGSSS